MTIPLGIDPPDLREYNFPTSKLDPKATEQLLIGKKVSLLKNLDERKNVAIASIATAAILLVGGLIATFMVSSILGSIMIIPSILLGTSGSMFFVMKKYLDPKQKIEFDKDELRFAIFEKVLQYDTDRLEGYDLLQKAIEDRSKEPKDKEKVYIALRQLKRHLSKANVQKIQFEKGIEKEYQETLKRLEADKNYRIGTLRLSGAAIDAQVFQINKEFNDKLIPWNKWKKTSLKTIVDQYKIAIDCLNLQYDKLLDNLGKPEPESWKDYLWHRATTWPAKDKAE
ncbi:MAG: hypothetical protein KR126chlam4_00937 [Candidatus Anoxychlamydiales bacterium]|nr:hypothetical protein [Candidatus Anoxychlamydiales bacterium]